MSPMIPDRFYIFELHTYCGLMTRTLFIIERKSDLKHAERGGETSSELRANGERAHYRKVFICEGFRVCDFGLTGQWDRCDSDWAIFTQRPPSMRPKQSLFVHMKQLLNIKKGHNEVSMGTCYAPPTSELRVCGDGFPGWILGNLSWKKTR